MTNTTIPARANFFTASAACTLLVVMAWGVWQLIGAVRGGLDYPDTLSDFREGRMTQTIEKQIDQKLPARATLIAVANSLRYKVMGGGGEQVRLGKDDWLYLTEELRHYPNAASHQAARLNLLDQVNRSLRAQGVTLLVALVPDKARLYPEHLTTPFEGRIPTYTDPRYAQALATLRAKGIQAADVWAALAEHRGAATPDGASSYQPALYYRTDTHWNNAGAARAAEAIAQAVGTAGLGLDSTGFVTKPSGPAIERPGDLIKLMGLSDVPDFWRPQPDVEVPVVTTQTTADQAAGGLLGDAAAPPVTLIGTSYSLRGNFHGYLQEALSAKVLNTAKDGGGFLQSATEYFKDDAFKANPPKVVIWELPERFLSAPLEGKEAGWLATIGLSR